MQLKLRFTSRFHARVLPRDRELLKYNEEGRSAILRGVNQLANAVKVTLGPKGRKAKTFGSPVITKDGVTVATVRNTQPARDRDHYQ